MEEETEEKFMFSRVISRIKEMQSIQYLETAYQKKNIY